MIHMFTVNGCTMVHCSVVEFIYYVFLRLRPLACTIFFTRFFVPKKIGVLR